MSHVQPFSPDEDYCVYCHAPAAGQCARCGALCCAECADLVMGLITHEAVCRGCLGDGARPNRTAIFLRAAVAVAISLALVLLALVYLSGLS